MPKTFKVKRVVNYEYNVTDEQYDWNEEEPMTIDDVKECEKEDMEVGLDTQNITTETMEVTEV